MSIPANDFGAGDDSDSDAVSDCAVQENGYRPISAMEDSDEENSDGNGDISTVQSNGDRLIHRDSNLSPSFLRRRAENGISSLDLNGNGGGGGGGGMEGEQEEEEEEEESEREASIWRAFGEDESRRSAPLTRENAARVIEAMRGVSFQGFTPDWADRLPEDRWIDQLRRQRRGGEPTPQI